MTTVLDSPLTAALAWALLHFLWQGLVIGGAVFLLWRLRLGPAANYAIGVVALGAMLVAPIATTAYLNGRVTTNVGWFSASSTVAETVEPSAEGASAALLAAPIAPERTAGGSPLSARLSAAAPAAMLMLWIAGVVVLSIRLLGGWVVARRLITRGTSPVTPEIASLARRVAGRLALDRVVRVLESRTVAVPVMVGWLRPVVLFPVSALSGLTPTQIEALLAHELAHIQRHDYLVNLLQSVVETLLFYHPAVWWVSRRVREEREHCCDDLAIGVSDRLTYATALTDLAALVATPRLALAATDGSLGARVRRILGDPPANRPAASGWLAGVLMVVLSLGVVVPVVMARPDDLSHQSAEPHMAVTHTAPTQTVDPQTAGGPTGIPGGVAGGVAVGIPGGVAGGVAVGVPGGAAVGAPGGVAGGLPGGAPAADQSSEQLRTEAEKKMLQAESRFLAQQYELERQRIALERNQRESSLRNEIQQVMAEFEKLKAEQARAQRRSEIGLATDADVLAIQMQLRQAEARLQTLQSSQQSIERQMQLSLMDAEQKMERERSRLEMLKVQRELEAQSGTLLERAERDRNRAALQAQFQALEQKFRLMVASEQERARREARLELGARLEREFLRDADDQTRAIQASDVLGVIIEGEPGLPVTYPVSESGTIRLPLLGTLRVAGRTTAQVRDEIARVLADRRLLTNAKVEVRIKAR